MKTLEELKVTPYLCIKGRMRGMIGGMDCDRYHVYHGWVEWPGFKGTVIFGFDESGLMEHVSVSSYKKNRLPTWDDMCRLKDMFFRKDEMVVQIHPEEKYYVHGFPMPDGSVLGNILHLWRPMNGDFSILNDPERWQ